MDTAEAEAMQGKSALTERREALKLLQERYRTQNENEDVRDQNNVLGENEKEALLRFSDEYADAVSRCLCIHMSLRVHMSLQVHMSFIRMSFPVYAYVVAKSCTCDFTNSVVNIQ